MEISTYITMILTSIVTEPSQMQILQENRYHWTVLGLDKTFPILYNS